MIHQSREKVIDAPYFEPKWMFIGIVQVVVTNVSKCSKNEYLYD